MRNNIIHLNPNLTTFPQYKRNSFRKYSTNFNKNNNNINNNKSIISPFSGIQRKRSLDINSAHFRGNGNSTIKRSYNMFNYNIPIDLRSCHNCYNMFFNENTVILHVKLKFGDDENKMLKIRRFDDLFSTVSMFCERNQIPESLVKPLISKIFNGLNSIYKICNFSMNGNDKEYLRKIYTIWSRHQEFINKMKEDALDFSISNMTGCCISEEESSNDKCKINHSF